MIIKNLLSGIPSDRSREFFETILETGTWKLERIVSTGQATEPGKWYDQDRNEWVLLLSGEAGMQFESGSEIVLRPGDCLLIPGHRRHRVEWTATGTETIWLALHFDS